MREVLIIDRLRSLPDSMLHPQGRARKADWPSSGGAILYNVGDRRIEQGRILLRNWRWGTRKAQGLGLTTRGIELGEETEP